MVSALPFPSIYLLTAHLTSDELRRLEMQIPTLTRNAAEADVLLGKISRKERAQFELRRLGITAVEESSTKKSKQTPVPQLQTPSTPPAKRRKTSGAISSPIAISDSSSTEDEQDTQTAPLPENASQGRNGQGRNESAELASSSRVKVVKVVKLAWFNDSVARDKVLPLSGYTVYEARIVSSTVPSAVIAAHVTQPQPSPVSRKEGVAKTKTAQAGEARKRSSSPQQRSFSSPLRPTHAQQHASLSRRRTFHAPARIPSLVRKTTSEHEESEALPPIPDYLQTTYSCQRPTPVHPANEKFIDILKRIRTTRQLVGDKIGVRAYSTAVASLAAYPHVLSVPAEVSRLPGCGPKIAQLFREFAETGHVLEADDDEADGKLFALRLFNDIWGVAETTARSFYNRGWRDLDDVIEFGWKELTRVQQIGVKFYDEFQELMTRAQVETIANRVLAHANQMHPGFHMIIAGGYRRGKELNGDVDVILSHPDETATHLMIANLVLLLEQAGLVTHTLTLSTANSERDQEPVSWKGNAQRRPLVKSSDDGPAGGAGFDTLDKALVVWQEPAEAESKDRSAGDEPPSDRTKPVNPNPHRRVDIVVSPWKTVGCAVLGWSGGTTFQRDLRRYCKYERELRFDSSGARSRLNGSWVDLEDFAHDPAPDMLTAERRVFAKLELAWRPPDERCTG